MDNRNVSKFIYHLRESSDIMYRVFTEGSCFKLFLILNEAFNDCIPFWSDHDSHCIIQIDNRFYDIGGEVRERYVKDRGYYEISKEQISGYSLMKNTRLNFEDGVNRSVRVEKYI